MNAAIKNRISLLRKNMADNGIDTFILTKFDPHQSAYGRENWNYVKYFSGFTGSAGTVAVTAEKAAFWTDGRYALQSKKDLAGTEYLIFNTSAPADISLEDFITENTPPGGFISFDERTLSMKRADSLIGCVAHKKITFKPGMDAAIKSINEPVVPVKSEAFIYDLKYAGVDRKEKLERIRKEMEKKQADCYILSSLEDIAWTLNVRSKTDLTLSFEAYLVISKSKNVMFVNDDVIVPIKSALENDGIEIRSYESIFNYIADSISNDEKIMITPEKTCFALYNLIKNRDIITTDIDITTNFKAVKNDIEIENYKAVSIIDGVGIAKFIKWIKEAAKTGNVTEYQAAQKLLEIRLQSDLLVKRDVISNCSYGENAAFNHYKPSKEGSAVIKPEGMLLIDVVGHYLGGVTDITRTIVLGEITHEIKANYTLVLKCHIALATLVFMEGMSGHYIDIVARRPLWDKMLDFKHGTGHGISAALSVHEGPHRIATQPNNVPIVPGMFTSNEPGFYKNGEYGIRLENIILCNTHGSSEYGNFLNFETVSFAPFDLAAIDKSLLTADEVKWLNDYHAEVYEKLSPYLNEDEKAWLKDDTRGI